MSDLIAALLQIDPHLAPGFASDSGDVPWSAGASDAELDEIACAAGFGPSTADGEVQS